MCKNKLTMRRVQNHSAKGSANQSDDADAFDKAMIEAADKAEAAAKVVLC